MTEEQHRRVLAKALRAILAATHYNAPEHAEALGSLKVLRYVGFDGSFVIDLDTGDVSEDVENWATAEPEFFAVIDDPLNPEQGTPEVRERIAEWLVGLSDGLPTYSLFTGDATR